MNFHNAIISQYFIKRLLFTYIVLVIAFFKILAFIAYMYFFATNLGVCYAFKKNYAIPI